MFMLVQGHAAGVAGAEVPLVSEGTPPKPLIEVVGFGVAPVAGIDSDDAIKPKPGDIVHRQIPIDTPAETRVATETRVRAGESWRELMRRLGSPMPDAAQSQAGLLPALAAGKYVRSFDASDGRPAEIEYVGNGREAYTVTVREDSLQVAPHASDPRTVERVRADPSKASLFTATDAIGLPDALVLQLAEIFAGDVDFLRELHFGYRCSLVYEVNYRHGHIDRPGRILAAEFVIRNRNLQAYYFDGEPGRPGYYTADGRSMRKIFRRAPMEFSRVTSEYTLARFHPILGIWRAHRGIDYAAPEGTPVVATSTGVVEFAGERNDFGNLVILDHRDRYQTYYGHLKGFADGLRAGVSVEQGQVIGYVGMTGLATGPHLHYEFRVRGGNGDWLSVPEPETVEAPRIDTAAFIEAVAEYREKLSLAARAHFVILD